MTRYELYTACPEAAIAAAVLDAGTSWRGALDEPEARVSVVTGMDQSANAPVAPGYEFSLALNSVPEWGSGEGLAILFAGNLPYTVDL